MMVGGARAGWWMQTSTTDDAAPPESYPGRLRRWWCAHPLLAVGLVATAVGLGHAVWICTHRRLGALDPDESGYIATALRYQRSLDLRHLGAFIHEVGGTGTGPMVPLASVPLLLLGPRNVHTVMLIQPLLMVFCSVAVAGVTRHVARPGVAIAAGGAVLALPTVILATQSYWFGLGAAAAMIGALWALVESERGANSRIWWFGVATGCMLLARTMAAGFLPALVVAALVAVGWNRRGLLRLGGSLLLAALIAGPWWIVEWSTVTGYLVKYGYGKRATLFGTGDVFDRTEFRLQRIFDGIGGSVAWAVGAAAVVGVLLAAWRWRRGDRPEHLRTMAVLAVVFVIGNASLVSTSNNGVWFELPLVVALVPLGAALVALAPPMVRALPAVAVVGMAIVQLASAWWIVDPSIRGIPLLATNYIDGTHYEDGFAQYDARFATARRSEQRAAADDWWKVNRDVERSMRRIDDAEGGVIFSMSGNMQMLNSNSLTLVAELDNWGVRIWIPDTTAPASRRRLDLDRWARDDDGRIVRRDDGRPFERVLVVSLHDRILFTPDRDVASFAAQARRSGWHLTERFDLPGTGEVQILRYGA